MRKSAACLMLVVFYSTAIAEEYPVYESESIVVTANRIPSALSDVNRSVAIIDKDDIDKVHAGSLPELLEYAAGVDVQQRGVSGAQADVSMRGGTFEQTLVLLDGIKINDPQTGHHNIDLPVSLKDIERIEILRGSGSRLYGPDAFGGIINVITKKGSKKSIDLETTLGDYKYSEESAALSYPIGISRHRISLEQKNSTGYRYNTDFDITSFSYKSSMKIGSSENSILYGFTDKKFGANSFYSDQFPGQWENTKTSMVDFQSKIISRGITFSHKLYLRSHKDHFLLDKDNPAFYENLHTTNVYGIELHSIISSGIGLTDIGGEAGNEDIKSESLGDHSRLRAGIFVEQRLTPTERISIVPGISGQYYANWGWNVWPGVDIGYRINKRTRIYGSAGKSFRVPTYTELYYNSPANMGNPDLKPEEAWTYETGISRMDGAISGNLAIFRRNGRDLVDWVRVSASEPWVVRNVARLNTTGIELSVRLHPDLLSMRRLVDNIELNYTFLDSNKSSEGLESKYALNHLRHNIQLGITHRLPGNASQRWNLRYEDRLGGDNHFILDTGISYEYRRMEFYANITNLLNTEYSDLEGIPMPGRWATVGIRLSQVFGE